MWAGDGDGESAKFCLAVLTDLRNRGVQHVFFIVCDVAQLTNQVTPLDCGTELGEVKSARG